MAHSRRNFVIAYMSLVLLPVMGLVGVLKHGHRLTAPLSVEGVWKVQADDARLAALPCGALVANADSTFTISQSGTYLVLDFNNRSKASVPAVLDGTTIKAAIAPAADKASDSDCGADRTLTLSATVDPQADPRSLVGMLSVNDCPSCTPVEVRAVRTPPVAKGAH
ncbi:MAG: hypothetical protein LAN83_06765 [Acidobacteriia bacterium]|nr:hypothetical protein [Terriglobia bacterium]